MRVVEVETVEVEVEALPKTNVLIKSVFSTFIPFWIISTSIRLSYGTKSAIVSRSFIPAPDRIQLSNS